MDKKQLLNAIEHIDYKIQEHISNDEFDIEPTQIPDYLLTARRVLIEKVKDIDDKKVEQRVLGGFYKGLLLHERDERETIYPVSNICIIK